MHVDYKVGEQHLSSAAGNTMSCMFPWTPSPGILTNTSTQG